MERLSLQQIQTYLLGILLDFDAFCTEKGLRYSLAYGTLLGAVRHSGFIPWDDDADIMMPRPDFEVFVKTYKSERYRVLYNYCGKDARFISNFAKIEDLATLSIEKKRKGIFNFGLNIDIFPVDGAPSDRAEAEAFAIKCRKLRHRLLFSQKPWFPPSLHNPLIPMIEAHRYSTAWWFEKNIEFMTAYNFDESLWAGPFSGAEGVRELYPKSLFDKYIRLDFEGHPLQAVEEWDSFLKQQYGDYMTPLPEGKRPDHGLEAYLK